MSLGACSLKTERASRKSSKDKLPRPSREKASPVKKENCYSLFEGRPLALVCFGYAAIGLLLRTNSPAKGILTQLGHLLNALAGNLNTRGLTFRHLAGYQVRAQFPKSFMNAVTYRKTFVDIVLIRGPKLGIPLTLLKTRLKTQTTYKRKYIFPSVTK